MKRTATIEQTICNLCGGRESFDEDVCLGCGKDVCDRCKINCTVYRSNVHRNDGLYCRDCEYKQIPNLGEDELHLAYRTIQEIDNEERESSRRFDARRKEAEERLAELLKAKRKPAEQVEA